MERQNKNKQGSNKELEERLKGKLPIVEIAGHPFFVDIPMGVLRPKDDFLSQGIEIAALGDYEYKDKKAVIPYNPKTKEIETVNWDMITEIPKNWIPVELPYAYDLDPVGYARKGHWDLDSILEDHPFIAFRKARIVSWEELGIKAMLADKKERIATEQLQEKKTRKSSRTMEDEGSLSKRRRKK